MLTSCVAAKWLPFAPALLVFGFFGFTLPAPGQTLVATNGVEIKVIQGTVEVARAGQTVRDLASTQFPYSRLNTGDQVWVREHSRATLRLSDLTIVELGPNSYVVVLRPEDQRPGFSLLRGLLHLFHRDRPGEFYFRTPTASPVIRGTEFNLAVAEDGATMLNVLDGEVALTNALGQTDVKSGEAASVQPGRPPTRITGPEAINVIQWCLYYPAVLNLDEIPLSAESQSALSASLAAYRQGDVPAALAVYPPARQPDSDAERIYLAALLLAAGEVSHTEELLNSLSGAQEREMRLAGALETLIAAVKFQSRSASVQTVSNTLASSLLAESYYHQSRFELEPALAAARAGVEKAPAFAFGWARVAELEFSFGRTRPALKAVDRALELAPRQAQAVAIKGFLLAAENRIGPSLEKFDEAIEMNGELGNAWLGRGLCRIRQGQTREGVADLLMAAALEPNRALLRSYLGKGFSQTYDQARARRELDRAKQLDANDPTAWLYSALLNQQDNRLNDAVHDLEQSKNLNDNRQLYRSRLLLDQDLAVRQANLAAVYQDAGLFEQSVREAASALTSDYANYSAHLFLANSYAQQRDPDLSNLRYETVTLSEYLVAQLLAPVGGNNLSPYVSQQEYSRLFERQGFGLSSDTEYSSRGDWQEHGAQYGTFANFDYALDAYYESQNGVRPNNDLTLLSLSVATRLQLTPQDTVLVQAVGTKLDSGDVRQYYDPAQADLGLRIQELQQPNLLVGYHRAWSPESHTLFLAGRLHDDFQLSDPSVFIPTFRSDFQGIFGSIPPPFSQFDDQQESEFVAYSAELQQILQIANNTLVFGGRFQTGSTDSQATLVHNPPAFANLVYPSGTQTVETHLRRAVGYAYDTWQPFDPLWLIGGISYDWVSYPENIDLPPISSGQTQKDLVSPKAGAVWLPTADTVLRGAYTRSLGGLYYDNSVRLEPTQVAGFNQAFRSLIPESVAGLVAGAEFETGDVDFSWRLPTGTYLGIGGEWLRSEGERVVGAFNSSAFSPIVTTFSTPERLDFEEETLLANVDQLISRDWALNARYRISRATLNQNFPDLPAAAVPSTVQQDHGVLQQLTLAARFAHPSGFFAEAQALWYGQDSLNHPGEYFWQFNVFGGYRFAQRRIELLVGGLNLTDRDYRLDPINLYAELPRQRTFVASLKFNF